MILKFAGFPSADGEAFAAPMARTTILEALGDQIERLRIDRHFKGSQALGAILRPVEGMKGAWALHLGEGSPEEAQR